MAVISAKAAVAVATAATVGGGVAGFAARVGLPKESQEAAYKAKTGKNILTGFDVELGLGLSGAGTAVATGVALLALAKFKKPIPGFVKYTPFIAAGIGAGILTQHVALEPVMRLLRQIPDTIEYWKTGGAE